MPATPEAIERLIEWARERRAARLRIEPDASPELAEALKAQGFEPVSPVQPSHSVILDMKPPDELLKTFRHGRRYNIRAGLKRGTVAEEGRDAAELERQSAAVERRESISLPGRAYYELLLNLLPWCRTYVARHPETKEALAAVLVARHAGRGYSLFAGRTGKHSGQRRRLVDGDLVMRRFRLSRLRHVGRAAARLRTGAPLARAGRVQVRVQRAGGRLHGRLGDRPIEDGCAPAFSREVSPLKGQGYQAQHILTILQID